MSQPFWGQGFVSPLPTSWPSDCMFTGWLSEPRAAPTTAPIWEGQAPRWTRLEHLCAQQLEHLPAQAGPLDYRPVSVGLVKKREFTEASLSLGTSQSRFLRSTWIPPRSGQS